MFWVVATVLIALNVRGSEISQRRAADRQVRAAALKSLPDGVRKAESAYLAGLAATAQWLITLQAKAEASTIVSQIESLDDKYAALADLKKNVAAIPAAVALDETKQKELATRLKTAQKGRATGLADLAATYYRSNLPTIACDLLRQAMDADPDNAAARQALGYVRTGTEWREAYAAQQTQKGNAYVPDVGWVPAAAAERVKKGEWCENGKWLPMDDADKLHAEPARPWIVETQNFTIRSTQSRKDTVAAAERCEGMVQACCHEYANFFLREKRSPQMNFTLSMTKKMQVHLFGQKAEYDATIKRELKSIGAWAGFLSLLPGFYTPISHASYFGPAIPEAFRGVYLNNQIAAQILSEVSGTSASGPKAWIKASVGNSIQAATPDEKGRWLVPAGHKHPAVTKATEMQAQKTLPALATLFPLDDGAFHSPLTPGNPEVAAALGRFLLETHEGAYAVDFLDFVYDSYKGVKNANLSDYIGIDNATLEKEFVEYLKQ
jgi:hypothetical protein